MVNMNMIVNKSDLVGYEAVDRTKARKEALNRMFPYGKKEENKKEI